MHENSFEKQVREKMDDLGFDPSDSVWAAVDKEINKEKKRRGPLFWIFFFSGLMLAGGGVYFTGVYISHHSNQIVNPEITQKKEIKPERQSGTQAGINTKKQLGEPVSGNISAGGNSKKPGQPADVQKGKSHRNRLVVEAKTSADQQANTGLNEKTSKESNQLPAVKEGLSTAGALEAVKKTDSSVINKEISPDLVKSASADSATDGNITSKKSQQKKSGSWKIGFAGSAGVSNINQNLFKSGYAATPSNITGYPTGNPTGSAGGPYGPATVHAGFSFGAGIFLNRNLSKRVYISAGLNYRYYSTKITTGNKVDSFIYVYTAAFQATTAVTSYYRSTGSNSYINQYHFVELPVMVDFQLNKSAKTPVTWEAGLSLAYLVSSNALQYDPIANVYFKNNGLLNKTQLNAATAILTGFHLYHAEMQLGPQLQYGLTGLLKGSGVSPEHLFYFGLKISVVPGNK